MREDFKSLVPSVSPEVQQSVNEVRALMEKLFSPPKTNTPIPEYEGYRCPVCGYISKQRHEAERCCCPSA